MNILITGGAGFIGANLIKNLLETTDHYVINIDKLSYSFNLKLFDDLDQKQLHRYSFLKLIFAILIIYQRLFVPLIQTI